MTEGIPWGTIWVWRFWDKCPQVLGLELPWHQESPCCSKHLPKSDSTKLCDCLQEVMQIFWSHHLPLRYKAGDASVDTLRGVCQEVAHCAQEVTLSLVVPLGVCIQC